MVATSRRAEASKTRLTSSTLFCDTTRPVSRKGGACRAARNRPPACRWQSPPSAPDRPNRSWHSGITTRSIPRAALDGMTTASAYARDEKQQAPAQPGWSSLTVAKSGSGPIMGSCCASCSKARRSGDSQAALRSWERSWSPRSPRWPGHTSRCSMVPNVTDC